MMGEGLYRVHYTDVDDNRRTVQRAVVTGPLFGGDLQCATPIS